MFKKIAVMLCLLLLVVGIVSAADNNTTDDALKADEGNSDEKVEINSEETLADPQQSTVTVRFVSSITEEEFGSTTNTINEGGSWGIGLAKFNNMIANHRTFKMDGYKYTFTTWTGDNGVVDSTQRFYCTGEDYTVVYYANYDKELLGRLTFIVNDEHGHNGHMMTYTDEANYKFTFKQPVDVDEGYEFKYYENAETGDVYNPGDIFSMNYAQFKGKDVTVVINAVYEKISSNDTGNGTGTGNDNGGNNTGGNGTGTGNDAGGNNTGGNGTSTGNDAGGNNTGGNGTGTGNDAGGNNTGGNGTNTGNTTSGNNTGGNGTNTGNTTSGNNTGGNGTGIDDTNPETDEGENESIISNNDEDNEEINDINDNALNDSVKLDDTNRSDDNLTVALKNHKTGIVFTGIAVIAIALLGVLVYRRRFEN